MFVSGEQYKISAQCWAAGDVSRRAERDDVAVMITTRHNASAAILNRKRTRFAARDGRQPRTAASTPTARGCLRRASL